MYKKVEDNGVGQLPLCPSHFRDGEKPENPLSKKKSNFSIIFLIIFFCGFALLATLFYVIASSKGHRMTFQFMYKPEKNNESSSYSIFYDEENKLMVTYDMLSEDKLEERDDSFKGYIGYRTFLKCHVERQPNSFKVYWFHNHKQIDTSNKKKYQLNTGDLEIKNLTENDGGNYKCLIIYEGNFTKASYYLEVQHAYKWVEEGSPELEDPAYGKFSFNNKFSFGQIDNGESTVPGIIIKNNFSTIKMLNGEVQKTDKVKILMINKNVEYDWVDEFDGNVPPHALEVGQFIGDKLYLGLTLDSQELGMVYPEEEVMYLFITEEDNLMKVNYKVFVLKT